MAGRPRTFDRDAAIDRFVDVFWARGYGNTSVDDLQTSIGVKRGSFYAAFGGKDKAFVEALARYVDTIARAGFETLGQTDEPERALSGFLRLVGEFMTSNPGRGCLLLSTIADPPRVCEEMAKPLQRNCQRLLVKLEAASEQAVGDRYPVTGQALKAYAMTVILGLNAMAHAGEPPEVIRAAANTAADLLDPYQKQPVAH